MDAGEPTQVEGLILQCLFCLLCCPIIPWTPVIITLIHHQSCLLSSRPANHQAILMYWDAKKKQQGTDSSGVTIVPLKNPLIVHIFKVEHVVPAINRILI